MKHPTRQYKACLPELIRTQPMHVGMAEGVASTGAGASPLPPPAARPAVPGGAPAAGHTSSPAATAAADGAAGVAVGHLSGHAQQPVAGVTMPVAAAMTMSAAEEALIERATVRLREELKALVLTSRAQIAAANQSPRSGSGPSSAFGGSGSGIGRLVSGRGARSDRRPLFHEKRFEARESLLTEMVRVPPAVVCRRHGGVHNSLFSIAAA